VTVYTSADLLAVVRHAGADDRAALAMLVGAYLESGADSAAQGGGAYGVWQLQGNQRGADTAYAAGVMLPEYQRAVAAVDPTLWASNPERAAETAAYRAERPAADYYTTQGPARVAAAYRWAADGLNKKGTPMTALHPGAAWRPVDNHSGPMSAHLGLILHVQVGNGSVYGEFTNPASQASYTWWVAKDGTLEQYVDGGDTAWAQAAGNGTYNSVGTEGFPEEALTDAQMSAIAGLYRWGHDRYGWPYTLADSPGQPGFGWHGMGDSNGHSGWGGHPSCPGDKRKAQRQHILDLAQGGANQGGFMPGEVEAIEGHIDATVRDAEANIDKTVQDTRADILALLQRVVDKLGA
jgi:hypothetical protein